MTRPFVLGVAGGSGSGKTTVAERLAQLRGPDDVALLRLDSYYLDRSHLPFEERAGVDYDHPDEFDWNLLLRHVDALHAGQAIDVPVYDFATHTRAGETITVAPARIVVVEGILVLYEAALRERLDLAVFVDTDADVRFIRRLERDVSERGRTPESVIEQYLGTVRPAHLQFVEPSKRYADVIVPHGGMNAPALDVLLARLRELCL
ncbi:MAG: uridine kinase [Actinomycetota bacterium]|nr:uridine kinase [Actinomycetota bacterium]